MSYTEMNDVGGSWGVLAVRPGQEFRFRDGAVGLRRGIGVYFPIQRVKSRPAGARRARVVLRPVFVSYMFFWPVEGLRDYRVWLDRLGVPWWTLRLDGEPAVVSWDEIRRFRGLELQGYFDELPKNPGLSLRRGVEVVILSGPGMGLRGVVAKRPRDGDEVVQVDLANATARVKVENVQLV